MDHSAIAVRYAKAFFETAREKNLVEVAKTDFEQIEFISQQSAEFKMFLDSPIVKTSKKKELIPIIFGGKINPLTLNFILLIVENKRESHIPGICHNFLELVRKNQNIRTATLTTAANIDIETLEKARAILEKELGSKIELTGKVNPQLIGGLILRIDDIQYDASIASQLKKIKQKLLESELNIH